MRPAKGAVFNGWKSHLVRNSQPPIASLEVAVVTMRAKRRQSGNRVKRQISPEMLRKQCGDIL